MSRAHKYFQIRARKWTANELTTTQTQQTQQNQFRPTHSILFHLFSTFFIFYLSLYFLLYHLCHTILNSQQLNNNSTKQARDRWTQTTYLCCCFIVFFFSLLLLFLSKAVMIDDVIRCAQHLSPFSCLLSMIKLVPLVKCVRRLNVFTNDHVCFSWKFFTLFLSCVRIIKISCCCCCYFFILQPEALIGLLFSCLCFRCVDFISSLRYFSMHQHRKTKLLFSPLVRHLFCCLLNKLYFFLHWLLLLLLN